MDLTSVDCTLCENPHGRYCVPRSSQHRPAAKAILRGKVWEAATIEFMCRHAYARDIVHAGTFFGDFLPALSKALAPGRRIFAFEPNPENFACAQWTCVLNGLSNVDFRRSALGHAAGTASLRVTEGGKACGGSSQIVDPASEIGADLEEVEVVTIDASVPPEADVGILQLDVEGHERFVLRGALETIARCRPIVILESVPKRIVDAQLVPLGYRLCDEVCGNSIFATERSLP